MVNINCFTGAVKLLETPVKETVNNNLLNLRWQAVLPPLGKKRTSKVITLVFWNKLASDVIQSCKMNDYVLVEGYLSLSGTLKSKKVELTVLKIYPFEPISNRSGDRIENDL